ncbi:MAG: hypothetical protein M3Y87_09550 [Myxococcota bacterium]|nr:hypothetical protein [Myxococcota bacterium]
MFVDARSAPGPTARADQRTTFGWVGAGCGGMLVLLSPVSFAFFLYVG